MYVIKNLNNQKRQLIILLLVIVTVGIYANCGPKKDPEPPPINENLFNTWKVSKVTAVTTDVTADYEKYQITFEREGSYSLIDQLGAMQTGRWELDYDDVIYLWDEKNSVYFFEVTITPTELKFSIYREDKTKTVKISFVMNPVS